jgi:hypothetical protein
MGDGVFKQAILSEPQKPEALRPGSFEELRYRFHNRTAQDVAAENSPKYASYTGRSFAHVLTTNGTELVFYTQYHPYVIDRLGLGRVAVVSKKVATTVR